MESEYEKCNNCNRNFFVGRLALHLKSCKPNRPFKAPSKMSTTYSVANKQTNYTDKI
jgi:hypothetical protein